MTVKAGGLTGASMCTITSAFSLSSACILCCAAGDSNGRAAPSVIRDISRPSHWHSTSAVWPFVGSEWIGVCAMSVDHCHLQASSYQQGVLSKVSCAFSAGEAYLLLNAQCEAAFLLPLALGLP